MTVVLLVGGWPREVNLAVHDPVVIVGAARTAMGGFQGEFKSVAAPDLGAAAIRAAVERAVISPADIDDVLMGCVLSAGQGQAPARQAAIAHAAFPTRLARRPSTRCAAQA